MKSTLSIPTDNLYKFKAVFGLAIIIASLLAIVITYNTLDQREFSIDVERIKLENSNINSKHEAALINIYKQYSSTSYAVMLTVLTIASFSILFGFFFSMSGFLDWKDLQKDEDDIRKTKLQLLKKELSSNNFRRKR